MRRDAAPFDHRSWSFRTVISATSSHVSWDNGVAMESFARIPAVGRNGAAGLSTPNFLNVVRIARSTVKETAAGEPRGFPAVPHSQSN